MQAPTAYADLNEVLHDLVARATAILGDNFYGAYLQGSFAVGDADLHSDVDFLVVTRDEVSPKEETELQFVHAQFPDLDVGWAQHLEGSYVPMGALRRPDPARTPWLYVDNGSKVLERSDHDNTAVTRWVLREYGVVLMGPDPKDLIDTVTAIELRREVLITMRAWAAGLGAEADTMNNAWKQPFVVLSYCRMLHTLHSGRVTSKLAAGHWALGALDAEWASLIQRALEGRPDPWVRVHQPGDPWAVESTWRFIDYALATAGRLGAGAEPRA